VRSRPSRSPRRTRRRKETKKAYEEAEAKMREWEEREGNV